MECLRDPFIWPSWYKTLKTFPGTSTLCVLVYLYQTRPGLTSAFHGFDFFISISLFKEKSLSLHVSHICSTLCSRLVHGWFIPQICVLFLSEEGKLKTQNQKGNAMVGLTYIRLHTYYTREHLSFSIKDNLNHVLLSTHCTVTCFQLVSKHPIGRSHIGSTYILFYIRGFPKDLPVPTTEVGVHTAFLISASWQSTSLPQRVRARRLSARWPHRKITPPPLIPVAFEELSLPWWLILLEVLSTPSLRRWSHLARSFVPFPP